jgi:hypothetical protein
MRIAKTRELVDTLVERDKNHKRVLKPSWGYVDALYVGPPAIVMLGEITGDLRYLRVGVRQLAYALRQPPPARDFVKRADPCGAILLGASSSSGATFAFNYPGLAAFAAAARPLGLLAWLDYPEVDEPAGGDPLPPLPRDPA